MGGISAATYYLLAVLGSLFLLPPLAVILYKLWFRIGCKKAYGTVLRIERNPDPDGGGTLIKPVISFQAEDGRILEVRTGVGYGLKYLPSVHAKVKLYYRPDSHPLAFQVANRGLWEVSGIFLLVGALLLLPLLLHYWMA